MKIAVEESTEESNDIVIEVSVKEAQQIAIALKKYGHQFIEPQAIRDAELINSFINNVKDSNRNNKIKKQTKGITHHG